MTWLQDMPVKRRLTLIIVLTCSAVLLLACGILAAYHTVDAYDALRRNSTVLADILAKNTRAALTFDDEPAARETLLGLQIEPSVDAACIYSARGNAFSDYVRPGLKVDFPAHPAADGYLFEHGSLGIWRPVVAVNGKRLGSIYLQANLAGLHDRLWLVGGIAGVVLFGSILVAFALSSRFQRPVSQPILALAELARGVAERKDFTLRAEARGNNEIAVFARAFNEMLGRLEERDHALRDEIAERKRVESRVQAQLARLELLNQITRAIGERLDLGGIFQTVLKNLEEHLPADFAAVCVYDSAENVLKVFSIGARSHSLAVELDLREHARVAIDQNGLSRCISGRLVYEPDIAPLSFPFPSRLARGGLRSLVLAPLLVESKVFGVLMAARRKESSFSSGECEFIRQLSEHAALAAHQSQLYTDLQHAYDELRQTQQAVMQQERLRALGQMASGIAHDINNAISPAALYTESLLESEPGLTERARDYLTTIQHAVEDVAHTVARMREFYRQRETQLELSPIDLNSLADQVIDMTRARWSDMPQQRGIMIKMETDLASGLPVIMGVESEIREALINLVFNAVDAMPDGGVLTLRTVAVPEKPGGAPLHVRFEVSDTGLGMDTETQRRCLEPFFTTKGERGTGLGLAMVYGILQRHSADLEIDSAPGEGTTMRLTFPASITFIEPPKLNVPYVVPSRLRILLVDDDPVLLKSLRDALEGDGHLIVTANGGQPGIDAFKSALGRREPFSIVITDLGMPYVDGRKVSAALKEMSPATPVILLTGWGQRLIAEGDVPPHVDRVLNKPPKLRELRETLAHFCHVPKS